MKKTLNEELKRILGLTYGEKSLSEGFVDDVLKKIPSFTDSKIIKKIDDPKKADFVSRDVSDFFETLESIESPIFQQERGSMKYQRDVETVQIALIILGYELPKYGVDGLFGPETGAAVEKFKIENKITDGEFINEGQLSSPIPIQGVNSPFGQKRSYETHPGVDLKAKSGTPIKSPADGIVIDAKFKESACGGTIQIEHGGGFKSRYCHCKEINVSQGQTIKKGDIIGLTGGAANDRGKGNSQGPHLHFELKKDGRLVDPMDFIDRELGDFDFTKGISSSNKSVISVEMVNRLIQLLKDRGVKSEDILKNIDPTVRIGNKLSLSGTWVDMTKELLRKHESYKERAKWDENAYRGGFGSDKKLVNGKLVDATKDTTWTIKEAEETMDYEIKNYYAPIIIKQLGISNWNKLNDKQKAALVSLGYNAGPYFLSRREYGRNIKSAIENNNMEQAAYYIEKGPITGAGTGKVYAGLTKRRKEEAQVFMS